MIFQLPEGYLETFITVLIVVLVIFLIITILLAVWVYKDAKKRDMNAAVWLLIVLLTGCIGCIIYLIVRD